ncbi:hypothetical protein OXX79_002051 [Metschnikowia pulcherrima]
MSLAESIDKISIFIGEFVGEILPEITREDALPIASVYTKTHFIEHLASLKTKLKSEVFSQMKADFLADDNTEASEETSAAIAAFNGSVGQQSREFVLQMGFTTYSDSILTQVRQNRRESPQNATRFKEVSIKAAQLPLIASLCTVIDALMSLSTDEEYASSKSIFYALLQHISEFLALYTDCISVFWYFVESRAQRMRETVFSPDTTSNRIAILSLCNSLTDRVYKRGKTGRLDSYAKDSFNDTFQARVRVFLAGLLHVDDSTGLNKYFTIANRENREPALRDVKSGDSQLLADVLSFYKLLRDPYSFLKDPKQLALQADSLLKLHAYLMDEEFKYSKRNPARNIYAFKEPFSNEKKELLKTKYADIEFFPEQYWLSPFQEPGADFDAALADDQERAQKRFDSSKFRKLLILQIFLASCFFYELQASRKKLFLQNIGALPTTKHIIENYTPDVIVPRFLKIKRDTMRLVKSWDSQWAFTLHHLALSEEYWWAWLIYGKSKDGRPLLAARTLTQADLAATEENFGKYNPEKTKRYFNSHATPQLSRLMKAKTGLALLKRQGGGIKDYASEIKELTVKIEHESDKETRRDLIEEKTVLIWKQTRALRDSSWITLNDHLDPADLENEEEQEEEEEIEEEKKAVSPEDKMEIDENQNLEENNLPPAEKNESSEDPSEPRDDKILGNGNGTLNTPEPGQQSIGELAGDHVAETRVQQLSATREKSVGEIAGEAVAETRKRERSPESESAAPAAKKGRTGEAENEN